MALPAIVYCSFHFSGFNSSRSGLVLVAVSGYGTARHVVPRASQINLAISRTGECQKCESMKFGLIGAEYLRLNLRSKPEFVQRWSPPSQ